jgi:hydroxyacylglutathione hydrolase
MFFRQVLHGDLGCASYLIADTGAGDGAVVDPKWEIDEYLELAGRHGFRIGHVIETHNHADHVSGRSRLVEATGARVWVHRLADATYEHSPFEDGDEIAVGGSVLLRVLHTPGHRPEHSAIVVVDRLRGDDPVAVLTGDSLFVNDAARPDLAVEKREGAAELFASLQRIVSLGDAVEVHPGHTGGSLCGSARMGEKTSSTVGYERAHNSLLQMTQPGEFVEAMVSALPPQPPNFQQIAETNRTTGSRVPAPPRRLTAERFARRAAEGGLMLDGRTPEDYAAGHAAGSVGVTLGSSGFGTKAAWLASAGAELLLIGQDDTEAERMAELLGAVGLAAAATLAGGFPAWRAASLPVESLGQVDVPGLAELLEGHGELQLLDVRGDDEWAESRIAGSTHMPYHALIDAMPDLDRALPVAAICSSGKRAAMAVGLLQRGGFADVIHVTHGGVKTWGELGFPLETGEPAVRA